VLDDVFEVLGIVVGFEGVVYPDEASDVGPLLQRRELFCCEGRLFVSAFECWRVVDGANEQAVSRIEVVAVLPARILA